MVLISKTLSSYDEQISAFYFATNKYFHDRPSYRLTYVTWPISPRNFEWKSKKVDIGLWVKTSEFFILLEGATNVENLNEGEQLDLKFLGNFLTFLHGTSDYRLPCGCNVYFKYQNKFCHFRNRVYFDWNMFNFV